MKSCVILVVVLLFGSFTGFSQAGHNPVLPGWYADPEAAVFDHRLWIFPTYSARYEEQVFLDAFSSRDGVTFDKHARILDTNAVRWAKKAMWAPSVFPHRGRYYLFFSANDVHEGEIGGIGVAVADRPEGPYRDLIGKPLIGQIHQGAQPIDQFVFSWQGNIYMVYGGWRHCNIVRLNDELNGLLPMPDRSLYREITPEGYVEGPMMFERDGRWYFMWSEGGWTGPDYRVAYAIADSPFGPWKRIGTVLQQDAAVATGAGHHSIAKDAAGQWYMVYHRRPLGETAANHRVTCIDKMEFDANGFILPVTITHGGIAPTRF